MLTLIEMPPLAGSMTPSAATPTGWAPAPESPSCIPFRYAYGTELDATLERIGIEYLIVTGCTTSVCLESTIRDAMFRDYSCVLLADCTGEPLGQANHEASLLVIQRALGWVSESDRFLKALQGGTQ